VPGQSAYPARRNKIFRAANTQAYSRIAVSPACARARLSRKITSEMPMLEPMLRIRL
jgi:hypothetical protein